MSQDYEDTLFSEDSLIAYMTNSPGELTGKFSNHVSNFFVTFFVHFFLHATRMDIVDKPYWNTTGTKKSGGGRNRKERNEKIATGVIA